MTTKVNPSQIALLKFVHRENEKYNAMEKVVPSLQEVRGFSSSQQQYMFNWPGFFVVDHFEVRWVDLRLINQQFCFVLNALWCIWRHNKMSRRKGLSIDASTVRQEEEIKESAKQMHDNLRRIRSFLQHLYTCGSEGNSRLQGFPFQTPPPCHLKELMQEPRDSSGNS